MAPLPPKQPLWPPSHPSSSYGPPSTQAAPTAPLPPKQPLQPPSHPSSPYSPPPTQAAPMAPLPPKQPLRHPSHPSSPYSTPPTKAAPKAPLLPKQPLRPPSYQSRAPKAPLPPKLATHACLTLWTPIRSSWYCTSISPPGLTISRQPPPASTPAYSATEKSKLMEALRTHTSLGDTSYLSRK